ncbi:hypothetical protein KCP73_14425 [Salmonella enterica subsp. enterica]|nr:hypothetical protein KCP73_14425 [Salmonella enterica subsp. enterica]
MKAGPAPAFDSRYLEVFCAGPKRLPDTPPAWSTPMARMALVYHRVFKLASQPRRTKRIDYGVLRRGFRTPVLNPASQRKSASLAEAAYWRRQYYQYGGVGRFDVRPTDAKLASRG